MMVEKNICKKTEIKLKKIVSNIFEKTLTQNISQIDDKETYKLFCSSSKLPDLKPEHLTKVIDNLPLDKDILTALLDNPKLHEIESFYPTIKSKIEQLD